MQEVLYRDEIHERVADVAPWRTSGGDENDSEEPNQSPLTVLEVHAQIHEVDAPRAHLVDEGLQIRVRHLVGDVLDHDRGPCIHTTLDRRDVEKVLRPWGPLSILGNIDAFRWRTRRRLWTCTPS